MFRSLNNKAYYVGGCVRDELMGIEPQDIDYVIEATESEFKGVFPELESIGKDFPVYLINGCEVALTRSEKSTGTGHTEFDIEVGVPIIDDLFRRDYSINSIAKHYLTGEIVDPFYGKRDIADKILCINNNNSFLDDPVRILRGLRFSIKYNLGLDYDTYGSMLEHAHLVSTVKRERINKELEKIWNTISFYQVKEFLCNLEEYGLIKHIFPLMANAEEIPAGPKKYHGNNSVWEHTIEAAILAKKKDLPFSHFMAVMYHDVGKCYTKEEILPSHYGHEHYGYKLMLDEIKNLKLDSNTNKLILASCKYHMKFQQLYKMRDYKVISFLKSIDNLIDDLIDICSCDHEINVKTLECIFLYRLAKKQPIDKPTNITGEKAKQYIINLYLTKYKELKYEKE